MWYYRIHGNSSQLLEQSNVEYSTEQEALAAGAEMISRLFPMSVILSLQAGWKSL
jgi:hypothetical protein